MKKLILYIILFLLPTLVFSQGVGINTHNPNSELDIKTKSNDNPGLMLNPQSAPIGSATGQMAVIGDKLFQFDGVRNKWLSVETTTLEFVWQDKSTSDAVLSISKHYYDKSELVDAVAAVMPFDGTIVYASSNFTTASDDKRFDVRIEDPTSAVVATLSPPIEKKSFQTDLNVDFDAFDRLYVQLAGPGSLRVPIVTLWVKWRK